MKEEPKPQEQPKQALAQEPEPEDKTDDDVPLVLPAEFLPPEDDKSKDPEPLAAN